MRRALGSTGLTVSALGLGTVKFGRNTDVRYPRPFALPDEQAAARLLDEAHELGLCLLDTAPAYGDSEQRLGRLLRGRRQHWVLCTKAGEEYAAGVSRFDFTPTSIRASVLRSLARLDTERLDIVLLHSDGNDVAILEHSGALDALRGLQHEGRIGAIGISVKSVAGGLLAASCCDVVMLEYSHAATAQRPVIAACAARGCGVLVKKALGSGALCARMPVHEALAVALAEPGVGSVVVGTLDPAHLRQDVSACREILSSPPAR